MTRAAPPIATAGFSPAKVFVQADLPPRSFLASSRLAQRRTVEVCTEASSSAPCPKQRQIPAQKQGAVLSREPTAPRRPRPCSGRIGQWAAGAWSGRTHRAWSTAAHVVVGVAAPVLSYPGSNRLSAGYRPGVETSRMESLPWHVAGSGRRFAQRNPCHGRMLIWYELAESLKLYVASSGMYLVLQKLSLRFPLRRPNGQTEASLR